MTRIAITAFLLLVSKVEIGFCAAENSAVRALVYEDINAASYDTCILLTNGTREIGCQSSFGGNVGVLFHVNESSQIHTIVNGKHHPYIVVIHDKFFQRNVVNFFQSSGKVSGIVVYSSDDYAGKKWSPEPKCPRYRYGLYNSSFGDQYANCQNPWNEVGDGASEDDINFPIFFIKNDTASNVMLQCHDRHNLDREYPLCAAQMNARMDAAVSTETCVRRNNLQKNSLSPASYCNEIGDHTILGSLQATNNSDPNNKPVILITAALDSRSFDLGSSVPGANSATAFVSLLAVAQALGNLTKEVKDAIPYDILFVLFNGEAFDNMGSVRMVYDMSKGVFPVEEKEGTWQPKRYNLSDVSYVIEIGQVGLINDKVWMHYDPIFAKDPQSMIQNITDAFKEVSDNSLTFVNQSEEVGLIPSSLRSILRTKNVSGVVVTDFDTSYANKYYFSRYDTPDKLGVQYNSSMTEEEAIPTIQPLAKKLVRLSGVVAKAVYNLATGTSLPETSIDENLVSHILYCYYYNDTCTLFRHLLDSTVKKYKYSNTTVRRYVGVYSDGIGKTGYFARNLLAQHIGEVVNWTKGCESKDKKDEIYEYLAFSGNFCIRSTVYTMDGRSPSAVISGYDYANGPYGAWAESRWAKNALKLSIFLVQETVSQGMVLFAGLLMLFTSFAIVFIITRKVEVLFHTGETL